MRFSNKTLRDSLRVIHLVIAGMIAAHLYSPLAEVEWFTTLVRFSTMPVLVLTGLSMWQMPVLTKLLKR